MLNITVKDAELRKALKKVREASINMRPLMAVFYGKVHNDVMLNFRLQSAPPDIFKHRPGDTRKTWKRISKYTSAARLGGRPSTTNVGAILQESGGLRGSMGKVQEITKNSMTYGTSSGISAVHHFGTIITPKRAKFLALPYPGVTGRPREYTNTFFRGKTLYRNKDGKAEPLFFLKEFVKIPARPHLTISNSTIKSMQQLALSFISKGFTE